ncbi:hypothetical protein AAFN60_19505 [Roseibacillus persicicus]|uniref:hypothetical protein n=1 Tax=Roseibacillus persicicus TaxID=454148 RepID=UPI00398B6668
MLENIRKYTGLFIVVLVLIFVGLVFLQSNMSGRGPSSGPIMVKTKDKTYAYKDVQKAENEIRLGQRILQTSIQNGSFDTYGDISQYLGTLEGGGNEEMTKRYLVHRENFNRARKEFGLYPSKEEIDLYQREKVFTGRDGVFDDESYNQFTDKGLRNLGMTINDLNDFIGNLLAFKEFTNILGAGVVANEEAAQESFISNSQQFTLSTLSLDLADFKKDISPTDEEVKTYWEENKGRYETEAKRRLTYFTAAPDFDAALAKKKEEEAGKEKTPAEEAADAEKTPEQIAADDKAKAENLTLTPEERKKLVDELGLTIEENIWVVLQGQIDNGAKKAEIEPLAEEFGYEVKTTELLPISELPAEIRGPVRGTQTTVEQELLDASLNSDNVMDTLSEILGVGQESWLMYRVDEAVEPTEKTFEEAKEDAKNDLVQEKAEEALKAAIESAREEVAKALADGKPLNEAAAEQNLKLAEHLTFTANGQVPSEPNPRDIFRLASQTKTGEISSAEVIEPLMDRGVFVFVKERTFEENEQNKAGLTRAVSTQQQALRMALVQHWFTAQFDESEVELVTLKN